MLKVKEKLILAKKNAIKVRITYKSFVRDSSVGKIFNFHGFDLTSEIGFVIYGRETAELFQTVQVDCLCAIVNFEVEMENSAYQSGTGNAFRIKLNSNSIVKNLTEDSSLPKIKFHFISLEAVQGVNSGDKVDVLGILVEDYGLEKNEKGTSKRDLSLTDASKDMVIATIWASEAENFSCKKFSSIVIRKANVIKFQGTNKLNCLAGTLVWCDSKIPEALNLENWFEEAIEEHKSNDKTPV